MVFGEPEAGRARLLTTQGISPYATVADIGGMAGSMLLGGEGCFSSENPLASTNPFIRTPIEAFANRNVLYGTPLDHSGNQSIVGRMGTLALEEIPAISGARKIRQALTMPDYEEDRKLYQPSVLDALLAYFAGLPVRDANLLVAKQMAARQRASA